MIYAPKYTLLDVLHIATFFRTFYDGECESKFIIGEYDYDLKINIEKLTLIPYPAGFNDPKYGAFMWAFEYYVTMPVDTYFAGKLVFKKGEDVHTVMGYDTFTRNWDHGFIKLKEKTT